MDSKLDVLTSIYSEDNGRLNVLMWYGNCEKLINTIW